MEKLEITITLAPDINKKLCELFPDDIKITDTKRLDFARKEVFIGFLDGTSIEDYLTILTMLEERDSNHLTLNDEANELFKVDFNLVKSLVLESEAPN